MFFSNMEISGGMFWNDSVVFSIAKFQHSWYKCIQYANENDELVFYLVVYEEVDNVKEVVIKRHAILFR